MNEHYFEIANTILTCKNVRYQNQNYSMLRGRPADKKNKFAVRQINLCRQVWILDTNHGYLWQVIQIILKSACKIKLHYKTIQASVPGVLMLCFNQEHINSELNRSNFVFFTRLDSGTLRSSASAESVFPGEFAPHCGVPRAVRRNCLGSRAVSGHLQTDTDNVDL